MDLPLLDLAARQLPDLLVKLYDLPPWKLGAEGPDRDSTQIRAAMAYEKHRVVDWVRQNFGPAWASECDVAFANRPISCYIATYNADMVGFACYDSTCRGFFGPIGVAESARGRHTGRRLLLACLHAMTTVGYAYAVIGGVGGTDLFRRAAGAIEIPGSTPGIYRDPLKSLPS